MSGSESPARARTRPQRGIMESLLTIMHVLEVLALGFGALAVWGVTRGVLEPLAFVGVAVLLIVTIPLLGKPWGWIVSLVCQLLFVALAFIEIVMVGVGLVFVAMWIFCFVRARQIQAAQAAHAKNVGINRSAVNRKNGK